MDTTLYVLRQHPDRIPSSLFQASDRYIDIVFVEQTSSIVPSSVKGSIVAPVGISVRPSYPTITYGDLIEKIFSSKRIIVV